MENNQENEQIHKETGSNLTGTAIPKTKNLTDKYSSEDDDELRQAEEELPDANKFVENTDALIGDVEPTKREQPSQEENNADKQKQDTNNR